MVGIVVKSVTDQKKNKYIWFLFFRHNVCNVHLNDLWWFLYQLYYIYLRVYELVYYNILYYIEGWVKCPLALPSRVHAHTRFDAALYIILIILYYGRMGGIGIILWLLLYAVFKDEFGRVSDFKYGKKDVYFLCA